MNRPAPRELTVIGKTQITPHMLRITLGGDGFAGFPADQESAYIKLLFPQQGDERPLMRTYTIRQQRTNEIDVDFVLHDTDGPASRWAKSTEIGGYNPNRWLRTEKTDQCGCRMVFTGRGYDSLARHQRELGIIAKQCSGLRCD